MFKVRSVFKLTKQGPLLDPVGVRHGLVRASAEYLRIQTERINRGCDVLGRPFGGYSKKYGEMKSAAGRTGGGEWLRLTGGMLRSQKSKVETNGGSNKIYKLTIGFDGTYSQGHFAQNKRGKTVVRRGGMVEARQVAYGNNNRTWADGKKHPFVGITAADVPALLRAVFLSK